MQTKCALLNKETKISYNKVLVKSDCNIDILYLTESNSINMVSKTLPIMGFIDVDRH